MNIISGFKGLLDFYVWKGIACVRAWPRSPGPRRAPAVEAQWAAFTWAVKGWNLLSPEIQEAYRLTASGTNLTGRDLFVKSFITPQYLVLE